MSLTPTADKVIAVAKSQVGYHEGRDPNGNWNNHQKYSPAVPGLGWSQGMAWCATFVSWVAMKAGVAALFPRTASTDTAASWYQSRKRWSTYPAIGAQGFLAHKTDEFHTFIVVRYDDTYIYTVEGNSNTNGSPQGDGVYALKRRRRDDVVEGYGYPAYPEGIMSADPAWFHQNPKATVKTVAKAAVVRLAGVFHVEFPRKKHEENSNRGDIEAITRHFYGSDHDWQKDANGVTQNTHWKDVFARDGFVDPEGQYGKGDKFHNLPSHVVGRLVAVTKGKRYHIRTADEGIIHAAKVGLKRVYGEAKPNNDWTIADFRTRKATARKAGIGLTIRTMDNWKGWYRTLWRARAAGLRTQRIRMHGR
jgi:hypothetical protein